MEADDIYKYLGLFLVVLFLIYILVKTLHLQLNVFEGMASNTTIKTDKEQVPDSIKSNTTKVEDALLINKYAKTYEDTIIELDANMDMYILNEVLANAEQLSTDPGSDSNQKIITTINNVKAFKDMLNKAIKVLDTKTKEQNSNKQ